MSLGLMGRNNLISNKGNFVRTADEKLYTFTINYYICSYAPQVILSTVLK